MTSTFAKVRPIEKDGYKSDWERRYAAFLEQARVKGEILEWKYECEKLKLAEGAWYTPDFRVINSDYEVEWHEVKGFWTEAAKVRVKVAKGNNPYFRFFILRPKKTSWEKEEF